MAVGIVRIDKGNHDLLADIAEDVFDYDIKPDLLAAYLADPHHKLIIACVDDPGHQDHGRVIGQARGIIHLHPDQKPELYIENLGVTPAWRRCGIARQLMDDLIAWGEAQGSDYIWLGAEADNDEAIGFYTDYGMKPTKMIMFEDDE